MNLRRGFTFLELMLALVIVAIVAGAVSVSLITAFKARDGIVNGLEPMRQASTAVEFMRRDMESALPPTTYLADTFIGYPAGQSSTFASLTFDAAVDGPRNSMQTDVRLIQYTLVDLDHSHALVRNVTSNLLPVQNSSNQVPPKEILCRNVRSMTIAYYDGAEDSDPADWLDTWVSDPTQASTGSGGITSGSGISSSSGVTQQGALPYAVAVTLELEPPKAGDKPIVVTRVIQLPCAVPASQPAGTTP